MSIRNLEFLFQPKSVAVIGASNRPKSVGFVAMRNLLRGGFEGPILPVNPTHRSVGGVLTFPDVKSLPLVPDLALICTPPRTLPDLIAQLGERGTKAAIVLTAGLDREMDKILQAAKVHSLRILGPNCVGLLVPGLGLNASFAHRNALPGNIAFVSQSGALCTVVLDFATSKNIGFSHFISMGNSCDVDFGDVLDYLGSQPETQAILLYIEGIRDARKFMSASRAAARNKPVLVVKSGRVQEGAKAATSHTGALAGSDEVFSAAFRRAGMLRVFETEELFNAVETLARTKSFRGERLAILTNGGGPGVMATDALIKGGGKLANLAAATIQKLNACLPETWSKANPVDIIGDASVQRYLDAIEILSKDPEVDALLILHVPVGVISGEDLARGIISKLQTNDRNVFTCWLGGDTAEKARAVFDGNGIATYETPEQAVNALLHLVHYQRNQELLLEIPPAIPNDFVPNTKKVQEIIQNALQESRFMLTEPEAKMVLKCYEIPTTETLIAVNAQEAVAMAKNIGFPVALKILSPDISHKSDVGGVVLDLQTSGEVEKAAQAIKERLHQFRPNARLSGFTVQQMARRPGAYELILGMTTDNIFGPILLFGQGGTAVEVIGDKAVSLPPLNMKLARELIFQTKIAELLKGFRNKPPAAIEKICLTLVKVSQLITDIPEVMELDINPLLADETGVLALDARIRIAPSSLKGPDRLAIRPYPRDLEERFTLENGKEVLLRPIKPEDEVPHLELFKKLKPEDIWFRFFNLIREIPHSQMARYTQIDYDREMAFIATEKSDGSPPKTLGEVRLISDANNEKGEFAIVVDSQVKGLGLGQALMNKMIRYSKERGLQEIEGRVFRTNVAMLNLAKKLGFAVKPGALEEDALQVTLEVK